MSEDKFFSTMGWGGEGERSGHRVVFLSQDIVGSISCWCEGEVRGGEDPGFQRPISDGQDD